MIPLNKFINIGDKLQLKAIDKRNNNLYVSQISDIHDDNIIEILFPIYKNKIVYFLKGERLELILCKQDAIFELLTMVEEKTLGNIPTLRLKVISELKRIQRRNFYRLKIVKPIKYRIIDILDNSEETTKYHEGILLDVSEGGIMFYSKKEMEIKDLLELEIKLDTNSKMMLKGIIVRKQYNTEKSFLYEYGVRFEDISKADKEILTKFIFQEQRKQLQKGFI
ncbi:MAG: PilZ domain-containing protein [Lutispora sp.]|nr:PilZ domain-containing protein [Lutispora sp.]MDD4833666.1 PilZ domain-containing protein [Lutispora sp.]